MTLSERIHALAEAVAAELKAVKTQQRASAEIQSGITVFDSSLRADKSNWNGLVDGAVANSSTYNIRFPRPFATAPVVTLSQQRPSAGWRFVEIVEVTKDYVTVRCNYWGNDLTLHWIAIGS